MVVVDGLSGAAPNGKTKEAKETMGRMSKPEGSEELGIGKEGFSVLFVDEGIVQEKTEDRSDRKEEDFDSEGEKGDSDGWQASERRSTNDDGILFRLATRNIPHVEVIPQIGLNVYSILKYRFLVITRKALEDLIERLDHPIKR